MNKLEKTFYTVLIILTIFTAGVQFGIHHGRILEREDCEQRLQVGGGELSTGTPFNASNQEEELFYDN